MSSTMTRSLSVIDLRWTISWRQFIAGSLALVARFFFSIRPKQVELGLITRILHELPAAEVILTFAADALVNLLAEKPSMVKMLAPLELTEPKIHDLIQLGWCRWKGSRSDIA